MFPIGDGNSSRRTIPLVTYALIALNVLFFFVELSGGDGRVCAGFFCFEAVRRSGCRQVNYAIAVKPA